MEIKTKPVWYRKVAVPVKPSNKSLGLEHITVHPANENQKKYGIVCNCVLKLVSGDVRVTIGQSKKNPGTIYLAAPGQEKVGNIYYQNVRLKTELQAQVLKYIESLMK